MSLSRPSGPSSVPTGSVQVVDSQRGGSAPAVAGKAANDAAMKTSAITFFMRSPSGRGRFPSSENERRRAVLRLEEVLGRPARQLDAASQADLGPDLRSEEHTSELQSHVNLV